MKQRAPVGPRDSIPLPKAQPLSEVGSPPHPVLACCSFSSSSSLPLPFLFSSQYFFSCCFTVCLSVCLSISLKRITMESHSGRAGRGFRNHRVQSLYLRGEDARAQKEEVSGCNNFPLYSPPLPPGCSPFVRNLGLVMHPEEPRALLCSQMTS